MKMKRTMSVFAAAFFILFATSVHAQDSLSTGTEQDTSAAQGMNENQAADTMQVNDTMQGTTKQDNTDVKTGQQDMMNNQMNNENMSDFVKEAASGGMMEVELGKIAQQKASSQDVRDFGKMMERDHSKANKELKAIIKKENMMMPTVLNDEHKNKVNELTQLSGSEFDKEYISFMVEDHKEDIEKFQKAAESDDESADVKSWAQKHLPALQQHYARAQEINKNLTSISTEDQNQNQQDKEQQ